MVFNWSEKMLGGINLSKGLNGHFYTPALSKNDNGSKINGWDCFYLTTLWYSVACSGDCADPVLIDQTSTYMCEYTLAPGDEFGGGGPGDPSANTCFIEHPFIQGLMVPCTNDPNNVAFGINCSSFNFVSTTSDYQEAAVSDIGFKVQYIDHLGLNKFIKEFKITRPIWFGLPALTYDNRTITPGEAAEIAAEAVQYASDLYRSIIQRKS